MSAASSVGELGGEFDFARLLVLVLVGASCGAVGVWVMHFNNAILTESFTHAMLPGLVIAVAAGASVFLGALAGVAAAYLLLLVALRAPRTSVPVSHSVTVTTLLAAGALYSSHGLNAERLEELLFGGSQVSTTTDVLGVVAMAATIALALYALHGQLSALAFDAGAGQSLGVRSGIVSASALALLALAVSVAAVVAGSLLALALVTGPAFGAAALARRIGNSLLLAGLAGAGCAASGLCLADWAGLPSSATIALVACAWAAVATTVAARTHSIAGLG